MAKCPHCDRPISSINGEPISIKVKRGGLHGFAYCCPLCDAVLSVMIDQIAVKADTVAAVLRGLRKG